MSRLNQQAFEGEFCDRVAELALVQKSATYRPVFNAAKVVLDSAGKNVVKGVADPVARNAFRSTGEQIFRGSGSPDFWTSLKNMVLPAYGQLREMHGIRDTYMGEGQDLARKIRGAGPGNARNALIDELKSRTSQFRKDKDTGFTAIGMTAQPRMDALKIVPPALGAAGLAGAGGLWLGNEQNEREMKELLQNQTLAQRLKYVMFPKRELRNYFLGDEAQKQSSVKTAVEESLPLSMFGLSGIGRGIAPSAQDRLQGRGFMNRYMRGLGRDALTGFGGFSGGVAGAGVGGMGGKLIGQLLRKNPETSVLAGLIPGAIGGLGAGLYGGFQAGGGSPPPLSFMDKLRLLNKQSSTKSAMMGELARMGGALFRGGIRSVPPVARFVKNVAQTAVRTGVTPLTAATRQVGMMGENVARAGSAAMGNRMRPLTNQVRNFVGESSLPLNPNTFVPATTPSFRHGVKGLGIVGGLGGAGVVGAGAVASPEYRQDLKTLWSHPYDNVVKPTFNMAATPEGRGDFWNGLGFQGGDNPQWHKPWFLGT